MIPYYFTVTAGRCGQATFTELVTRSVPGVLALHEEPHVRPVLPRFLGDLERQFRRRFVETHELLGRGAVLDAFERGDSAALESFAARRLAWIDKQVRRRNAEVYVDVSKHFVRGMHRPIAKMRPDIGVIRLVRDPIVNMRSYGARGKNFRLDNASPGCRFNALVLDPETLSLSEMYLWAWCEVYLRFDRLVDEFELSPAVEVRTDDLNEPEVLAARFDALGLPHRDIPKIPPRNTNVSQGHGETVVRLEDIDLFERFRDRIPADVRNRIGYFDDYDPRALFSSGRAA